MTDSFTARKGVFPTGDTVLRAAAWNGKAEDEIDLPAWAIDMNTSFALA